MAWKFPDLAYTLAGKLCDTCAYLVRIRHQRGQIVVLEDQPVEVFLFPIARS